MACSHVWPLRRDMFNSTVKSRKTFCKPFQRSRTGHPPGGYKNAPHSVHYTSWRVHEFNRDQARNCSRSHNEVIIHVTIKLSPNYSMPVCGGLVNRDWACSTNNLFFFYFNEEKNSVGKSHLGRGGEKNEQSLKGWEQSKQSQRADNETLSERKLNQKQREISKDEIIPKAEGSGSTEQQLQGSWLHNWKNANTATVHQSRCWPF